MNRLSAVFVGALCALAYSAQAGFPAGSPGGSGFYQTAVDQDPPGDANQPKNRKQVGGEKPADPGHTAAIDAANNCKSKRKLQTFYTDASGNVSATGGSFEGPLCIEVHYNPLQFRVSFSTKQTRTAGPDSSTVLLGAATKSSGVGMTPPPLQGEHKQLSQAFAALNTEYTTKTLPLVRQEQTSYSATLAAQTQTIADIKNLLNTLVGMGPGSAQLAGAIGSSYKDKIYGDIQTATSKLDSFAPADQQTNDGGGRSVLEQLRAIADGLDQLPYAYGKGEQLPDHYKIDCTGSNDRNVGWGDWYADAACKQLYDTSKKNVQDSITIVQQYSTNSDNINALRSKAAIVKYWDALFTDLGASPDSAEVDLVKHGVAFHEEKCGNIFNQSSSTLVSLVTVDETPTLDGNPPSQKTQDSFLTVTCASPISISAGAAFSSIEQKEFAIVKSAGSTPGGPSVPKFGTLSDSRFRPMPMALVHARLGDSQDHKFGYHLTLGVAGNLQGQASGGSSAEFLTGMSLSFWRTIYLSAGLHVGTKAELAGGFHENDLAPSDISTLQGQVKRSYMMGFGFALSFGK